MKSQIPKRTRQIQRHYLDRAVAQRHCEDIEAYLEQELRGYIKYAVNTILRGSVMTHRQRVDFVRGWMRSWLADDQLHRRVQKPSQQDQQ